MDHTRASNASTILLLLVFAALVYGSMQLTHHAKITHAGEIWQASDIATYLDCHKDEIQTVKQSNGLEKHFCKINADMGIGLVIAAAAGVIVTGFMARLNYWRSRR